MTFSFNFGKGNSVAGQVPGARNDARIRVLLKAVVTSAAGVVVAGGLLAGLVHVPVRAAQSSSLAQIVLDEPLNGAIFPPDFAVPTFVWRDGAQSASRWTVDVSFESGSAAIHADAAGTPMKVGEIDQRCISNTNKLPELTAEQAASKTFKLDAASWSRLKHDAGTGGVRIVVRGYAGGQEVSEGSATIHVAAEPVGAPIFFRDVPLMPSETEKGFIKPLASSAIPLINWSMRNVADEKSHVVMTDLHTCANCHSFALNGKTLGLDMDGPQNDKGLYAMVDVARKMTIKTENMVSWPSFPSENGSPVRVGFMSQVSPDGRYVVTTTRPPDSKSQNFYYVSNFKDYRFLQVFYPTKGIVQWYDREEKKLRPLPGASDPKYVQSNAVWSPDGKYLVFSRAEAKDPLPADGKMAAYANDPKEIQIQYDLYRIPFNEGRGGVPERIEGASQNGMSNSFPKVSPDGKWIVFVQAKNGQLMRPDSQLYIVPFAGGVARRMTCNTRLMNSWHSWSPNGRWLVFSSKSESPYTRMFLTHVDENGNDSPAIPIENATAANRAVNIPEFVNMDPSGIEHIDTPAVDFYKQYDVAADLVKKGKYAEALPEWKHALEMSPEDARALNNYGQTLSRLGKREDAIAAYTQSIAARPVYPEAQNNLGVTLDEAGRGAEAIVHLRLAVEQNPGYAEAYSNLGRALAGQHKFAEAVEQYQRALTINPEYAEAHNNLGFALASQGKLDDAVSEYQQAIASDPKYAHAFNNLGLARAMQGKLDDAIASFSTALEIDPSYSGAEGNLGRALLEKGDAEAAVNHLSHALELGPETSELHSNLALGLAQKGSVEAAVPHFERALALDPKNADAHGYLGTVLMMDGKPAQALQHWHEALKVEPGNVQVLNNTAWLEATSPDATLRNGREAVVLAERAVNETHGRDPRLLSTLAAAYAESGGFARAVATEEKAAEIAHGAGDAELEQQLRASLATLQAGHVIRQR